jgi:nicotinate-nucleotide--dimethylbenzimidazole phosphoribosyltransferase
MVLNFTSGGAAINVLCRQVNAELVVVDMGVATKVDAKLLVRDARIAAGTANMTQGPAMTIEQTLAAIEQGILMAHRLADRGVTVIGLGEMGIGNTTAASALVSVLTGKSPREVTGRGTGIDDAGLAHKIDVIDRAIAKNKPSPGAPLEALAAVGGFEIAGLVGVVLGAAGRKIPLMIDGFITVAAALVAARLAPAVHGYLIASHRSVEPGHVHATAALGVEPLFDLQMRLGEGTGAALAMQMLDASIAILREMATFEDAHVADSGA